MISELLTELRKRAIGRALSAREKYYRLVAAAVSGKRLDVDEVDAALTAASKSHEDFEADCRAGIARVEARRVIARSADAKQKLGQLETRSEKACEAFRAAQAAMQREIEQIDLLRAPLLRVVEEAAAARRVLSETAPAELLAEQRELASQREAVRVRVQDGEKQLDPSQLHHDAQTFAGRLKADIDDESQRKQKGWEARVEEMRALLPIEAATAHLRAKREPRLAEARVALAQLDAELAKCQQRIVEA